MNNKISDTLRKSLFIFCILTSNNCGLQEIEPTDVIQPFPVESVKLVSKGLGSYLFDLKVMITSPCWRFYKKEINRVTEKIYIKILLHNRGETCPPEDRVINVPILISLNQYYETRMLIFWRSDTSSLDTTIILRE